MPVIMKKYFESLKEKKKPEKKYPSPTLVKTRQCLGSGALGSVVPVPFVTSQWVDFQNIVIAHDVEP